MHRNNSSMEVIRQFLAAFAYQDKDTLNTLFAPNINCTINCSGKIFSGGTARAAIDYFLKERTRWVQARMDIKSWQYGGEQITVRFHVQVGEDIFTHYLEYIARITVDEGIIKIIHMDCFEKKTEAESFVWNNSNPSVKNCSLPG